MSEKKTILIVEDETLIALDIEQHLNILGYTVDAIVNTGEKAIEKAKETRPDIVMMDITLKGKVNVKNIQPVVCRGS